MPEFETLATIQDRHNREFAGCLLNADIQMHELAKQHAHNPDAPIHSEHPQLVKYKVSLEPIHRYL